MVFLISRYIVFTAALIFFLSCASSPRYNRKAQAIPQQNSEQIVEKTTVIEPEPIPEKSSVESVVSYNTDTITDTESDMKTDTDTDTLYTFYQKGVATYYADKFQGRKTAFGERYDKKLYTAAHRTLPYNSLVRVTALSNKKSVIVRINDRGPFTKNRVIDLSKAAAKDIDLVAHGIMKVTVETVEVKR